LPAVDISLVVLGIQWHIRHMGIALRLSGNMSPARHVRPLLDAFFFVRPVSQRSWNTNLWISQSHGVPQQCLSYAISSSEKMNLTVVSMSHGLTLPFGNETGKSVSRT